MTKKSTLVVRIGGVAISFKLPIAEMAEKLSAHYKEYIYDGRPQIRIRVEYKEVIEIPGKKEVFLSTRSWRLGRNKRGLFLYFPRKAVSSLAQFDRSMQKVTFYTNDPSGQLLLYLFPQMLFRLMAVKGASLMLHSAGVLDGEKAYLFIAHSGGGKSTLAKLALKRGMTVLNDDRIIIRKQYNIVKVFGNPWHGEVEHTSSRSALIRGIFFIKKSKSNRVVPISKKDALVQMLLHSFSLPITKEMVKKRMVICSNILGHTSCYCLYFKPDQAVWETLDSFLNQKEEK